MKKLLKRFALIFIAALFLILVDFCLSEAFVFFYMKVNEIAKREELSDDFGFGMMYTIFFLLLAIFNIVVLVLLPFLANKFLTKERESEQL